MRQQAGAFVLDDAANDTESDTTERPGRRFVVLRHDWPVPHRDLILETTDAAGVSLLPTWALYAADPERPVLAATAGAYGIAVPLEAHRRAYLDYEGPVSGDRGTVTRESWGLVLGFRAVSENRLAIRLRASDPTGARFEGLLELAAENSTEERISLPELTFTLSERHAAANPVRWAFEWRPGEIED